MNDHRSQSLYYILRGAWFLQAEDHLLECVDSVINYPIAQASIENFAAMANMHNTKLIFDLQDQWPVRGKKFWCHFLSTTIPKIEIPRWPVSQRFRTLKTIMPLDAFWSDEDEYHLEWDPRGLALSMDPAFGTDQRLLQADDQAPTFLHSCGHVNRPCPCGCRAAFSLARLRNGGARGFG